MSKIRMPQLVGFLVIIFTMVSSLISGPARGALPLSDEPGRVLYQVYVESFRDGALKDGAGDFEGLESRLDYLERLGITGIMLMPVFESDGMGYIVHDFARLRADYGGSQELRERERAFGRLVERAHARGIKVLLDIPFNHISTGSRWFRNSAERVPGFEDYFLWSDQPRAGWRLPWDPQSKAEDVWHWDPVRKQYFYGLFGSGMPDLNHENPAVQAEILGLLGKYAALGVDGFRIDAAKHLVEGAEDNLDPVLPENRALLRKYLAEVREKFPHLSFMLEAWSNQYSQFEPYLPDAGDIVFDFAYMEALRDSLVHRHPWGVRNALKHLEEVQEKYRPGNRIVFAGNHDVPRIRTLLKDDRARVELAHALTLSLPFTPILYYGDEIFMPGDYIRSSDPEVNHNGVCTPMAWSPGPNAGFADPSVQLGEGWNKALHADWRTHNVATESADPESFLNFVGDLIRSRRAWAITNETGFQVESSDPSDPVLKYGMRLPDGRCVVALLNFSEKLQDARDAGFVGLCEGAILRTAVSRRSETGPGNLVQLGAHGIWIGETLDPIH